jgi:hypothetical protein
MLLVSKLNDLNALYEYYKQEQVTPNDNQLFKTSASNLELEVIFKIKLAIIATKLTELR